MMNEHQNTLSFSSFVDGCADMLGLSGYSRVDAKMRKHLNITISRPVYNQMLEKETEPGLLKSFRDEETWTQMKRGALRLKQNFAENFKNSLRASGVNFTNLENK